MDIKPHFSWASQSAAKSIQRGLSIEPPRTRPRLHGCLLRDRLHSISVPHLVLQASASERSRSSRPRASGSGSRKVMKIVSISFRGSFGAFSNIKIRGDVAIVEDQIVLGELLRRWNRGRWIRRAQGEEQSRCISFTS